MKTWTQVIQNVYKQKTERNWKELYWCIDLHDTIINNPTLIDDNFSVTCVETIDDVIKHALL